MDMNRLLILSNYIEEIEQRELDELNELEEEDLVPEPPTENNPLYSSLQEANNIKKMTNFEELELLELHYEMQPHWAAASGRGKKPSISKLDSLVLLLLFYKTGMDMDKLAAFISRKNTCVRNAIERTRGILLATLRKKFLTELPHPKPPILPGFTNVGILLDSTSIEVCRHRTDFFNSKVFWDTKNHMYARKKEVAVSPQPPYMALFIRKSEPGSVHDFAMFKEASDRYKPYLQKTPTERELNLDGPETWQICADKGYVGDAPGISFLVPFKESANITNAQRAFNANLAKIRVPVEQFFGRLKSSWKLFGARYRLDHAYFDDDVDNAILLTNLSIHYNQVGEADRAYFTQHLALQSSKRRKKVEKKRKAQR